MEDLVIEFGPDTSVNAYKAEAVSLIQRLWRGGVYGAFWHGPTHASRWHKIGGHGTVPFGLDWYMGVNPVSEIPRFNAEGKEARPEHVSTRNEIVCAMNCFYTEFDAKDFESREAMFQHIDEVHICPSYTQSSGGGVHAFWFFEDTIKIGTPEDRARMAQAQKDWVGWMGGDWGAHDLRRVLRVPGTYNGKQVDNPREVVPLTFFDEPYENDFLFGMLEHEYSMHRRKAEIIERKVSALHAATAPRGNAFGRGNEKGLQEFVEGQTDHRNNKTYWAACRLAEQGYSQGEIESTLYSAALGTGLTETEVRKTLLSAWAMYNRR
jgi:hypothetical protein